jgi:hypothetical protein
VFQTAHLDLTVKFARNVIVQVCALLTQQSKVTEKLNQQNKRLLRKKTESVMHSSSPREQTNVLLQTTVYPVTSEIGIKLAGYKN